jgi:hypothetical protein
MDPQTESAFDPKTESAFGGDGVDGEARDERGRSTENIASANSNHPIAEVNYYGVSTPSDLYQESRKPIYLPCRKFLGP